MNKPKKDANTFSFFSSRGTYGERLPTAEEVFERNREMIIKVQASIELESLKEKKND